MSNEAAGGGDTDVTLPWGGEWRCLLLLYRHTRTLSGARSSVGASSIRAPRIANATHLSVASSKPTGSTVPCPISDRRRRTTRVRTSLSNKVICITWGSTENHTYDVHVDVFSPSSRQARFASSDCLVEIFHPPSAASPPFELPHCLARNS